MVTAIKNILDEKGLGVKKINRFGSSLDPDRFDRRGEGTSDIDILAVVQATMPLEDNTQLKESGLVLFLPPNAILSSVTTPATTTRLGIITGKFIY